LWIAIKTFLLGVPARQVAGLQVAAATLVSLPASKVHGPWRQRIQCYTNKILGLWHRDGIMLHTLLRR